MDEETLIGGHAAADSVRVELAVVYDHQVLREIVGAALGRVYLFDDSFQPPAVRTMITILEKITQCLRNPPMPHD